MHGTDVVGIAITSSEVFAVNTVQVRSVSEPDQGVLHQHFDQRQAVSEHKRPFADPDDRPS